MRLCEDYESYEKEGVGEVDRRRETKVKREKRDETSENRKDGNTGRNKTGEDWIRWRQNGTGRKNIGGGGEGMRRDMTELSGEEYCRTEQGRARNTTEREGIEGKRRERDGTGQERDRTGWDGKGQERTGQEDRELERRGRHRPRTGWIMTGREGTEQDKRRREGIKGKRREENETGHG
ncbi:hypothetical protein E2C01_093717 [Portunus trituberculatus]|uniref:Uncharacterized protein n=1 Tax=Portunus trituberculatus TaxID=210409 RepID=A0A5B7JNF7_PORTR|nr:hypothetical protein [Portunus trituberculatus]